MINGLGLISKINCRVLIRCIFLIFSVLFITFSKILCLKLNFFNTSNALKVLIYILLVLKVVFVKLLSLFFTKMIPFITFGIRNFKNLI